MCETVKEKNRRMLNPPRILSATGQLERAPSEQRNPAFRLPVHRRAKSASIRLVGDLKCSEVNRYTLSCLL